MTASEPSTPEGSLAERVRAELATLERELAEIDMLIAQARTEAGRHETKRAAAADRLAALRDRRGVEPGELLELSGQLVTLTKRAALMEAQVDVLEGKKKALGRFRDSLAGLLDGLVDFEERTAASPAGSRSAGSAPGLPPGGEPGSATVGELSPAVSRLVLTAQEDLRRQIARAIHDGPAQALTNIVLQAEIVERLLPAGDERIRREVERLVAMVEHTLEATKTFIFDVRPMVLDDLGLVPTLRRAARERSRKARIPVEFDSVGQDRRLAPDVESGLFRIVDEAVEAYLAGGPERVAIRLDWTDALSGVVAAIVPQAAEAAEPAPAGELPPALREMIEDRRAAAAERRLVRLPEPVWRAVQQRAASIGATVELAADGGEVRFRVDLGE